MTPEITEKSYFGDSLASKTLRSWVHSAGTVYVRDDNGWESSSATHVLRAEVSSLLAGKMSVMGVLPRGSGANPELPFNILYNKVLLARLLCVLKSCDKSRSPFVSSANAFWYSKNPAISRTCGNRRI